MARRFSGRSVGFALALVVMAVVAYWAWDHRHFWIEHNFRTIEPGRIYAGGYQFPGPLKRIIHKYGIRTVVCLRREGDGYDNLEQTVLQEQGVRFIRVAIPKGKSIEAKLERVRMAAAVIAEPQNHPVLVHCWGGKHRAGAVVGGYRVSYCGWTENES